MKGKLLILNTVISNSRRRTQTSDGKKPKQFEIQEPFIQEDLLHWVKKVVNKPYKALMNDSLSIREKAWRDKKVEVFECDGKIFSKLSMNTLAQNEKEILF